ncbi:MAG: hypothetical protein J6J38_00355 [Lachnospiraceae bacterium]|nr:hypothetical protein [Lachnospiraceae bacterium]
MNIAFWSNVRHQSGVTSCVALMSVLWTELFVEEITVTSNHICTKGLVKRLCGGCEYEEKIAKKAYHYMLGEPEYFRMLYSGNMKKTVWLNENLRYIPMEGEAGKLFAPVGLQDERKCVEEQEIRLIDTACGYTLCSQKIVEDAEIKVILFPPDRDSIDAFFQSDTASWEDYFFIVGNYRSEVSCRPVYLSKRYHVPLERIGVIPYNFGFEQAMQDGSTIAYIAQNMRCSRRSKEYWFFQCAKETVKNLRKYVIYRRDVQCGECGKVSNADG